MHTADCPRRCWMKSPIDYAPYGRSAQDTVGAAVWQAGYAAVAAKIEVNYRKPVPLRQCIKTRGYVIRHTGRKIYAHGKICLPDGTVAVAGRGLYIIAPQLFEKSKMFRHE
jgi:acyl-CoA thioesterase FadM